MKISKRQLRRIIKEAAQYFQAGRGQYKVDMTALHRSQPIIADWVDVLLDEFKNEIPQAENIPDEKRGMMIKDIADAVWKVLPGLFGAYVPMEPGAKRLGESKMRITKTKLKQLIKEEKTKLISEQPQMDPTRRQANILVEMDEILTIIEEDIAPTIVDEEIYRDLLLQLERLGVIHRQLMEM
tara:strand:- start:311 stop:859 length:549 start_codon:yes stop_codon:yes gene_type:complete